MKKILKLMIFMFQKVINIFLNFLIKWPKWEKNFLNISGEKFSGKTHLIKIFLKKIKGIKIGCKIFK